MEEDQDLKNFSSHLANPDQLLPLTDDANRYITLRSWAEVDQFCQTILEIPDVQKLFEDPLGRSEIVLDSQITPTLERRRRRQWIKRLVVADLLIVLPLLFLPPAIGLPVAIVAGIFTIGSIGWITTRGPISLILTRRGPRLLRNGLRIDPCDRAIRQLELTRYQVNYMVGLEMVELAGRKRAKQAEDEALQTLAEEHQNIKGPLEVLDELEQKLDPP